MNGRLPTRRILLTLTLAFTGVSLIVLLVWGAAARSFGADRVRRAEIETREMFLHQKLANGEAILESQRRIYMERLRRLEARIRQMDERLTRCPPGP